MIETWVECHRLNKKNLSQKRFNVLWNESEFNDDTIFTVHRNLTAICVCILFCMFSVRLICFFYKFFFHFSVISSCFVRKSDGRILCVCCACVRMTKKTNESDSERAAEHINITSVSQPNGYECSRSDENSNHSHQRTAVCCLNIIRFYIFFLNFETEYS